MQVTISGPGDIAVSNIQSITSTDNTPGISFTAAGATVLGTAAQGAFYASDAPGAARTYDSHVTFTFDTNHLSGDFLIGLLDNASFGTGFDSLTFSIVERDSTVPSTSFTTLSAAQSFFDRAFR